MLIHRDLFAGFRPYLVLFFPLLVPLAGCGETGPSGPKGDPGEPGATGAPGTNGSPVETGDGGIAGESALRAYGDGSAGAHSVSANEDWSTTPAPAVTANLQFSDFTVAAGTTLTVPSGTVIRCRGDFVNSGKIVVKPGTPPGRGPFYVTDLGITWAGITPAGQGVSLSPAASGDLGSNLNTRAGGKGGIGLGELQARQLLHPGVLGGGAGANSIVTHANGNAGGGTLTIACAGTITNAASGIVQADGEPTGVVLAGVGGSGGGAGGVIIVASRTSVSNAGSISAKGSDGLKSGTNDAPGGGGGGGIVHLLAPAVTAGTVVVTGGAAGAASGNFSGSADRAGGGGGGACGGAGGAGGSAGANAPVAASAQAGGAGLVLESKLDPTSLL